MTYFCDNTWDIEASLDATSYSHNGDVDAKNAWMARMVEDPVTCKLLHPLAKLDSKSEAAKKELKYHHNYNFFKFQRESGKYSNIILILFSMTVPVGFIAGFSAMTFYVVFVYGIAGSVRVIIWNTWMGFTYEVTNPEPLIKLIECCYIMRHEENLVGEEECYRMLQEVIRQPQLYKELTGTMLGGSMHPDLDKLTKDQRKKLNQLDKLERKGWDESHGFDIQALK